MGWGGGFSERGVLIIGYRRSITVLRGLEQRVLVEEYGCHCY